MVNHHYKTITSACYKSREFKVNSSKPAKVIFIENDLI